MYDEYSIELKADLSEVPFPELVYNLYRKKVSGVITVKKSNIEKDFILKNGQVIFSKTNITDERLGKFFLKKSFITKKQYNSAVISMQETKNRLGRILVEMKAITPAQLWEGVKEQLKLIFASVFEWKKGMVYFYEKKESIKEPIIIKEDTPDIILFGIRTISDFDIFYHYLKDHGMKYVIDEEKYRKKPIILEPYEEYVVSLFDGKRNIEEVIEISELGEKETLRVLYILKCFGLVASDKNYTLITPIPLKNAEKENFLEIIKKFNKIFAYIYRSIIREVGPIGERIVEKNVGEVILKRADVFSNIGLSKDGTFDEGKLLKALWTVRREKRKKALIKFLDDLLMAEILAVNRVLGKEFEKKVISMVNEVKK